METELTVDGRAVPGLASQDHGAASLALHETPCFSGERPLNRGLFHTGCGGGPTGAGEAQIFSLNTGIQAVGEGNYGRLGAEQQKRYTDANVETQFGEPATGGTPDEQPGMMPEILPSPAFGKNIDRCWTCRSMFMQAWGNYGTAWPVVHQQLGVRPDLGRGRLTVVPQLPSSAPIAGEDIRLGDGRLDLVRASRTGDRYTTTVDARHVPAERLLIGQTLPLGSDVGRVTLDGRRADYSARETNRGLEVTVRADAGRHEVVVSGGLRASHSFSSAQRAPTVQAWTRLERGTGSTSPSRLTANSSGARPSRSRASRTPVRTRSASAVRPARRRPPQPSQESNGQTEPR